MEGNKIGLMKHLINWQRIPRIEFNKELGLLCFMLGPEIVSSGSYALLKCKNNS